MSCEYMLSYLSFCNYDRLIKQNPCCSLITGRKWQRALVSNILHSRR
ncbi:unnamed protein product [Schistosoma mattheei]|uniref:Uncharacterized protein n=1 Tax=Schistosoma mattheei TaxID=31246 RepID=A0A183Q5W8_9TREM|nr:unnamed protein product [Schistosoma mattheei]